MSTETEIIKQYELYRGINELNHVEEKATLTITKNSITKTITATSKQQEKIDVEQRKIKDIKNIKFNSDTQKSKLNIALLIIGIFTIVILIGIALIIIAVHNSKKETYSGELIINFYDNDCIKIPLDKENKHIATELQQIIFNL